MVTATIFMASGLRPDFLAAIAIFLYTVNKFSLIPINVYLRLFIPYRNFILALIEFFPFPGN
ncbi:MAG: hypothetical protein STSR0004_01720 [Peptococcaceae bacterium]